MGGGVVVVVVVVVVVIDFAGGARRSSSPLGAFVASSVTAPMRTLEGREKKGLRGLVRGLGRRKEFVVEAVPSSTTIQDDRRKRLWPGASLACGLLRMVAVVDGKPTTLEASWNPSGKPYSHLQTLGGLIHLEDQCDVVGL